MKRISLLLLVVSISLLTLTNCKKSTLNRMPLPYSGTYFYLPSGFSPNYDGINDAFKAIGVSSFIKNFKMKIYRNKLCIFDGTGTIDNLSWDGTNSKGKMHNDGKYKVKISYTDGHGESHEGESYVYLFNTKKYTDEELSNCVFPDMLDPIYGTIYATNEIMFNN